MSIIALLLVAGADPDWIMQKPITWTDERTQLTLEYRRVHYGDKEPKLSIEPRMIVVHHTAIDTFDHSFAAFDRVRLPAWRKNIKKASPLGVSVHFLVDQDGTVYRLMPDTRMGRHTIGLNWAAIGIENVGGKEKPLTQAQATANAKLIRLLKQKHPTIEYLIAHREYTAFRGTDMFRELDASYLTVKRDPSVEFMDAVRDQVGELGLAGIPKEALARAAERAKRNQKRVTPEELGGLTLLELSLKRNEIFARYGRGFSKAFLAEHFAKQPWYQIDPAFSYRMLTAIDRANAKTIRDFELGLTTSQLRVMRNAVFARHGRPFKSKDLDEHFRQQAWYKPDPGYSDTRLTTDDRTEIALVQEREHELAGVASLDNWQPGMSVSAKALDGATAWSLVQAYEEMVVALKLDLGDAFCASDFANAACAPAVRKHASPAALTHANRQAIAAVEQALAWALRVETEFRHGPDCEAECDVFWEPCSEECANRKRPMSCEDRCLKRRVKKCMQECQVGLAARKKAYTETKAESRRRVAAGQHPRGGDLLELAYRQMASIAA